MNRFVRFVSGIAVFLLSSFWAPVFVLAVNYEPRLRRFLSLPLFEIGLVGYFPVIFAFLGAYFLIVGAIKIKVAHHLLSPQFVPLAGTRSLTIQCRKT